MTIIQKFGRSVFDHSPGGGAYSLYFVRVTGATIAEGAITAAGLWEIEGPVGARATGRVLDSCAAPRVAH